MIKLKDFLQYTNFRLMVLLYLEVLFWKTTEPLGGRTSLEEVVCSLGVNHWKL